MKLNFITFKLQLNEEQKQAKAKILDSTITLLAGAAGSGKTLLACQIGLERLFMREVEKVIITRPTVSKEEIAEATLLNTSLQALIKAITTKKIENITYNNTIILKYMK